MIRPLIGKKSCMKPCFFKSSNDTLFPINTIVIFSRSSRKEHWHTFMRCIWLGKYICKCDQAFCFIQQRSGIPFIPIQPKVTSPCSFSHYQHIYLCLIFIVCGLCTKSKLLWTLLITGCFTGTLYCQSQIIAYVDRIHIEFQCIILMVCIAQCGQDDSYSHCHPGISPLAIYKVLIQFLIPCYRNNTQSQSGQIYHKYANHSRQQVI